MEYPYQHKTSFYKEGRLGYSEKAVQLITDLVPSLHSVIADILSLIHIFNYAASKGWIEGYEDGTFRPDEKITRAEAAAVLNRALLRLPESEDDLLPGRKVFPDNTDPKQWYYLILEEAANPVT